MWNWEYCMKRKVCCGFVKNKKYRHLAWILKTTKTRVRRDRAEYHINSKKEENDDRSGSCPM